MSETQGKASPVITTGSSETQSKTSPIVIIAAASVIIFSAVGVGVMTGIIPSSLPRNSDQQAPQKTEPAKSAAPAAPQKQAAPKTTTAAPARKQQAEPRVASTEPARAASAEPPRTAAARVCAECGTVVAIDVVEQKGEGSGLGAIAGGVVGGVLGSQVGRGSGRTAATVAGAGAGAYAGHEIEKYAKAAKRYDVAVRMEDGSSRSFSYEKEPTFRVGGKVKVVEGTLVAN